MSAQVATATALSAFDKATFEFHEPELRISNWDYDPISPDNNCILLESTDFKGKTLKDVYHDMSVPIVVFTSKCYQEIQYLTNKYSHQEWAVFLTMKKLDSHRPHFLAFDWFMPGQDANGGAVSVQAADSIKYYDKLVEKYPYYKEHGVHKFLCHLHSHHSMAMANFSSIDDRQQKARDDLGFYDSYRFYIVVTCNNGMKASMVSYDPAFVRTNAAVAITWSEPEYIEELSKARKKEIDDIAEKALFKSPYVSSATSAAVSSWKYQPENNVTYPSKQVDRVSYLDKFKPSGVHRQAAYVSGQVAKEAVKTAAKQAAYVNRGLNWDDIMKADVSKETVCAFLRKLRKMFQSIAPGELDMLDEAKVVAYMKPLIDCLGLENKLTEDEHQTLSGFVGLIGTDFFHEEEAADILCFMAQIDKFRDYFFVSDKKKVCDYIDEQLKSACDFETLFDILLDQEALTEKEFYENLHSALLYLADSGVDEYASILREDSADLQYGHGAYTAPGYNYDYDD